MVDVPSGLAHFVSEFEQLAVEMVDTFCANATLADGTAALVVVGWQR
jgi:hypothetical protein